jgi:hypothetical protein
MDWRERIDMDDVERGKGSLRGSLRARFEKESSAAS